MSRARGFVYRSLRWQRAPGKAPLSRPASHPPTNRRPVSTCRSCTAAQPPDILSRTPMCISVPRRLLRLTTDPTTTPRRVRQSVNGPIRASQDTRSVSAHRRRVAQDGQEPLQENDQRAGGKSTRGSEADRKAGRLRPAQPARPPATQVSHRSCGARVPQPLNSFAATIRPCKRLCPCGTVNVCGLLFASRDGLVPDNTSGHRRS